MGTITNVIKENHYLVSIVEEEGIQGYYERVEEARDNYLLVYSGDWSNPHSFQLQFDAFNYGVEQGARYVSECMRAKQEAFMAGKWN